MRTRGGNKLVIEHHDDEDVRPYIEQLMDGQNCSQAQAPNGQSNELHNSTGTEVQQNDESGNSDARKVRGPSLLKEIWKMPPGKTVSVQFNSRNQAIGKEGRKLASFLGIVARTPELTQLHVDDWRSFDKEEKKKLVEFVRKKFSVPTRGEEFVIKSIGKKWKDYKCNLKSEYMSKYKTKNALLKNRPNHIPRDQWTGLVTYWRSDKAKRRTQANRNNRAKQKMPHTGGSKSIATLMDEKAENGIEPTRAQIFILTHKQRKDGRPLDDESTKTIDMMNEKLMSNSERSNDEPARSVAWEGDVYSQVLGIEKSGYVRGVGLGPTPSVLWGSKSSLGNIITEDSSNEVKRLEEEITKLKELNGKQNDEMSLMKQELSRMKQVICKIAPNELSMLQNVNGISTEQVPDANSGHERVPQARQMYSVGENTPSSHDTDLPLKTYSRRKYQREDKELRSFRLSEAHFRETINQVLQQLLP